MDAQLALIDRNCPHCDKSDFEDRKIGRDPWTIGQCRGCGFVYLTSAPSYEELSERYAWEKSFVIEADRRKRIRPVFDWIDQNTRWRLHLFPRPETRAFVTKLVSKGSVLDLGCGDGTHASCLPSDMTPYGIEISRQLATRANERFTGRGGHCVHAPALEGLSQFDTGMFDGAMLNSYLEHEARPKEVLKSLRRVLKPTGIAVVKVPNFGSLNAKIMRAAWCGIRLPDHVNYFTEKSMKCMARDVGLDAEFPFIANLPTNDNFWAFLRPVT